MSAICEFQHKKFTLNKRKHADMEDKENIMTAQSILERALKDKQPEQPPAKRQQTKPLFRPWEDVDSNKSICKSDITLIKQPLSVAQANIPTNVMTYHPNMIRQHNTKPLIERRNRNTVPSCPISRRNQQAQQFMLQQQYAAQQYMAHRYQQSSMMEQSMRAALYLKHLQQIALQRQQQMFIFGQHY